MRIDQWCSRRRVRKARFSKKEKVESMEVELSLTHDRLRQHRLVEYPEPCDCV